MRGHCTSAVELKQLLHHWAGLQILCGACCELNATTPVARNTHCCTRLRRRLSPSRSGSRLSLRQQKHRLMNCRMRLACFTSSSICVPRRKGGGVGWVGARGPASSGHCGRAPSSTNYNSGVWQSSAASGRQQKLTRGHHHSDRRDTRPTPTRCPPALRHAPRGPAADPGGTGHPGCVAPPAPCLWPPAQCSSGVRSWVSS